MEMPSLPSCATWAGGCTVDNGAQRLSSSSVAPSSPRGRAHLLAALINRLRNGQRPEYLISQRLEYQVPGRRGAARGPGRPGLTLA